MPLATPSGPFLETLNMQSLYLCQLWVIRRRDQSTEYFTSWDEDLLIPLEEEGGTPRLYRSAANVTQTAAERASGLKSQTRSVLGVIDGLDFDDIDGGAYSGAKVTEYVVDARWPFLPQAKMHRSVYWVTTIEYNEEEFEFRLEGIGRRVQEGIGAPHSRNCRWSLGKDGCATTLNRANGGINIANFTWGTGPGCTLFRVDADQPRTIFDVKDGTGTPQLPPGTAKISHGRVTFLTGDNAGTTREVMNAEWNLVSNAYRIKLFEPTARDIKITDTVRVEAGCSGTFEACQFYRNEENFGGFRVIPGAQRARQTARVAFTRS